MYFDIYKKDDDGHEAQRLLFLSSLIVNLCASYNSSSRPLLGLRRCIKLQNPPRLHSEFSYCRQHASLKSATGDSSAHSGR
ncbi:hypothetical protein AX774_g2003 [Zancudomyces culisetae]|uniref:Uncharacterized protein n=1 Tax=Zancudomyces culisetae TaxID=1213189 RepID=A0A1R1PUA4_ZANCU|nr:hypothetical protein AX774_g2003 [Zancudomyces culisetae]|eukprot:OMH84483.1 hypothetical protein AX774_g2003 [Zancudomyces culisetae]